MNGNKKKIILISGINGFLGSYLAKTLDFDYTVIGLVRSPKNLFRIKDCSFKIYLEKNTLEEIFRENKIYAVIHAATVYNYHESINALIKTNVLLPVKLFELANRYGVKLFFNTDSFFNNSEFKYSYLSEYTLSKKHALEWLKLLTGNNCKLVNMKIFHMYGPNDSKNKFITSIISSLKKNVPQIDLTKGEQKRDFIFVKDVVNAYKFLLLRERILSNFLEIEIGSGKATSIKNIVFLIKKLVKSETKLIFDAIPYRKNEIMKAVAKWDLLDELGWKPQWPLKKGLMETIDNT